MLTGAAVVPLLQVWADVYTLPVPGADGKTAAQIFEAAGCTTPAAPSCAACLGGPRDTFARMNEPQVSQHHAETLAAFGTTKDRLPHWALVPNVSLI